MNGAAGVARRSDPHLLRKVIVTTLVAGVVWFGAWLLITSDYISFRHGWFAAPND